LAGREGLIDRSQNLPRRQLVEALAAAVEMALATKPLAGQAW